MTHVQYPQIGRFPTFLGFHKVRCRTYVIKQIVMDTEENKALALNEFAVMSRLPAIPQVVQLRHMMMYHEEIRQDELGMFYLQTSPFVVMHLVTSYYRGGDLSSRRIPLGFKQSLNIFYQLLDLILFLHRKYRIWHRDLKPENILIRKRKGRVIRIALTGWGDANFAGTNHASSYGSVLYQSPDHVTDEKAELWAAACIAHLCITGKHPCEVQPGEEMVAPFWFRKLIPRMFEPNPLARIGLTGLVRHIRKRGLIHTQSLAD